MFSVSEFVKKNEQVFVKGRQDVLYRCIEDLEKSLKGEGVKVEDLPNLWRAVAENIMGVMR